jgi:hypothetical protein
MRKQLRLTPGHASKPIFDSASMALKPLVFPSHPMNQGPVHMPERPNPAITSGLFRAPVPRLSTMLDTTPQPHAASFPCDSTPPPPWSPRSAGASQVLRRLSSCMPRPEDAGGPSHPRPYGWSHVAFGVRENPRRPQLALSKLYQHFRGRGSPYGLQDTMNEMQSTNPHALS